MSYTPLEWKDGPQGGTPITAAALNRIEQGIVDAHAVIDAATPDAQANTLVRRDSDGRASVASPMSASHIATKGYVDNNFVPRRPNILSVTFEAPFTVPAGEHVSQFLGYTGPSTFGAIPSLVPPASSLLGLEVVVFRWILTFPTTVPGIEVRLRNTRSSDISVNSDITIHVMIIPFP